MLPWYVSYTLRAGELGITDNGSTAGWFIKLFLRWSTHVNLKSCGNKILLCVAPFSRNHYCTTAGWDCVEINFLRFVRIYFCKMQFQLFEIRTFKFWMAFPESQEKVLLFLHLGVPLQVLLFLTLLLLCFLTLSFKFPSANVIEEVSLFLVCTRLCRKKS